MGSSSSCRSWSPAAATRWSARSPTWARSAAGPSDDIAADVRSYGAVRQVPAAQTPNLRNDLYLAADAVRPLPASGGAFTGAEAETPKSYRGLLDEGTRYIPTWVKVRVALALGLGTMVGWKSNVVTVGERIGKTRPTYAQGASAEIVAAGTIGLAELYGLPVSTTLRNMAPARALTLPGAITLAGTLFYLLRHLL